MSFRFTQTVASGGFTSLTGCTQRTSFPLNLNSIYQYKTKQRWAAQVQTQRFYTLILCINLAYLLHSSDAADGIPSFPPSVLSAHVHTGQISSGPIFLLFFKCCFGSVWFGFHLLNKYFICTKWSLFDYLLHISHTTRYAGVLKDLFNRNMIWQKRTRKKT